MIKWRPGQYTVRASEATASSQCPKTIHPYNSTTSPLELLKQLTPWYRGRADRMNIFEMVWRHHEIASHARLQPRPRVPSTVHRYNSVNSAESLSLMLASVLVIVHFEQDGKCKSFLWQLWNTRNGSKHYSDHPTTPCNYAEGKHPYPTHAYGRASCASLGLRHTSCGHNVQIRTTRALFIQASPSKT